MLGRLARERRGPLGMLVHKGEWHFLVFFWHISKDPGKGTERLDRPEKHKKNQGVVNKSTKRVLKKELLQ